MKDYEITSYW